MSKIGVVHYNYPGFSFDQFLRFAADTGYEYVELDIPDVWQEGIAHPLSEADNAQQSRHTEAVARHVQSFGLQISGIAARNDFVQNDAQAQKWQIARMKGIASQMRLLGENAVMRSEGGHTKDAVDPSQWRPLMLDAFRRCQDFLEELDVTLAIDNHALITNDGDLLLSLLRELDHPKIGANLDTMNFLWFGHDLETCRRYYRELAPFVRQVHLKDGRGSRADYQGEALGEGLIPLHEVIQDLRDVGFDGVYCAEYEGKEREGAVGYARCCKWMQANL